MSYDDLKKGLFAIATENPELRVPVFCLLKKASNITAEKDKEGNVGLKSVVCSINGRSAPAIEVPPQKKVIKNSSNFAFDSPPFSVAILEMELRSAN